jgi:hypothetical protein
LTSSTRTGDGSHAAVSTGCVWRHLRREPSARRTTSGPDGRTITFAEDAPEQNVHVSKVFMMKDDGSERVALADGGMPAFSFDGTRIAYVDSTGLAIIDR